MGINPKAPFFARTATDDQPGSTGASIRTVLAAEAMVGLLAGRLVGHKTDAATGAPVITPPDTAVLAVAFADALIAELSKPVPEKPLEDDQ